MYRIVFFLATAVLSLNAQNLFGQATEKEVHTREQVWVAYLNQTRLSNKFGFWLDVHYRQTDNFIDRPLQFIFRPALTYYIKDNLRFNAGYALVEHFPAKGSSTIRPEHRTWQQIWWSQKYSGMSTLQWLRLEERFNRKIASDKLQDGYNFNYRLRYNLSFFIPLKGKELVSNTPFVAIANELFLNFGERIVYNTFDQNRLFLGLGYQITPQLNIQAGYMNVFQQEAPRAPDVSSYVSTHALRVFVFHNLDFRKSEE